MIVQTCFVIALMTQGYTFDSFEYNNYIHWLLRDTHQQLAVQMIDEYGITDDHILEILYTAPFISIEIARRSNARFWMLAPDSTTRWFSSARINGLDLGSRFTFETGTPDALPFPDESFDLVICRDALRFWHDDPRVFAEIDRVLKCEGTAVLGAGLAGTIPDSLSSGIWNMKESWWLKHDKDAWIASLPYPERIEVALAAAGIHEYRLWNEESNTNRTWIQWQRTGKPVKNVLNMDSILTAQDAQYIGKKAPDFTLAGPSRDTVTLSDLKGDVVMLAFWRTQFRDWTILTHDLKPLYDSLKTNGLHILTINIDEDSSLVGFYYMDFPIPYPVLYDGIGVAHQYGVRGTPQFVFIDRQGMFYSRILGCTQEAVEQIRSTLMTLVHKDDELEKE